MKRRDFVPWKPGSRFGFSLESDPLTRLQGEMNRLFDGFCNTLSFETDKALGFSPSVDVQDTPESIVVRAELPGMSEKDVEITLNSDSLVIRGEKKHEEKREERGHTYIESSYGSFQRTIPLAAEIKEDAVDCSMSQGVLKITLPKIGESSKQARKVSIRTE